MAASMPSSQVILWGLLFTYSTAASTLAAAAAAITFDSGTSVCSDLTLDT